MNRIEEKPSPTESGPEVVSLGCRLNSAEAQQMRLRAHEAGLNNAVLVNSCAVTNEAVRQSRQALRKARRNNPHAKIIATGCAVQIDPEQFSSMTEVDAILDNRAKLERGSYAALTGSNPMPTSFKSIFDLARESAPVSVASDGRARAHVEIQSGCDHRCTFCIIPYGRGDSRSVPAGIVVETIRDLVQQDFQEIILTGVDLTSWGQDLPGLPTLGNLVGRILRLVPNLPWLRLSSLDVAEIDPELMDILCSEPRLCPYLHLSLQHGDNMILKRMKRRHLREDALSFAETLCANRSDITFGADLIAGFPTETEQHFEKSLKLVEEMGLTFLHIFPYSARKDTPAARMPQLEHQVIKARAAQLRALGKSQLETHLKAKSLGNYEALVEGKGQARLKDFTPVSLENPIESQQGNILPITVTGQDGSRLLGRVRS